MRAFEDRPGRPPKREMSKFGRSTIGRPVLDRAQWEFNQPPPAADLPELLRNRSHS